MAVKAVAERSLNPVARRFLFRVRCRSSRIMAMCVRYRLSSIEEEVAEFFKAEPTEELHSRYNIAPSQRAPVIRQAGRGRVIANVRWGLVPFWARTTSIGYGCSGRVIEEPAFRGSLINSPWNDTSACAERV